MSALYSPKLRERVSAGPRKGEEFGPCIPGTCQHRDCKAAHEVAAAPCATCGKPIGRGAYYYSDPLEHRLCAELRAERERARDGAK